MPFFCDLFELKNYDDKLLPPELIPYTQALYFDDSTKESGAQNYKLLFISPWHGKPGLRRAITTINWSTESTGSVGTALKAVVAQATEAATKRNNENVDRTIKALQDLAKGNTNNPDAQEFQPNKALPIWAQEAMRFLGVSETTQNYIGRLWNAFGRVDKGVVEKLLSDISYSQKMGQYYNTYSQRVGGEESKNKNTVTINASHQGYVKRDATSFKTQVQSIGAAFTSNDEAGLVINKSIVCKGSTKEAAQACIDELTRILAVVSPFFFYQSTDEKNKTDAFTALSLTYQVPNNFLVTPTDKGGGKPNSYEVFQYRGELQLRQGYTIYRNLVPAKVIVTASPDMVFLKQNPFVEDKNQEEASKKVSRISMTKDETNKAIKFEDRQEKIKTYWQTSRLYKQVKISPKLDGYLFPQWINVQVILEPVEPMDGVRASQQLFCYSGNFIQDM